MTQLLTGHDILLKTKEKARRFGHDLASPPSLAIILVGTHAPSQIYVAHKQATMRDVGFACTIKAFPDTVTEADLVSAIQSLNRDPSIHGILVQLPLPGHLNRQRILDTVLPLKDVDGLTSENLGRLVTHKPYLIPCTPLGCLALIHQWRQDLTGLHAVVVGQSTLVGKPLSHLLLQAGCTVTMVHRQSRDIDTLCRKGDILVCAVGLRHLIQKEWVKEGACVIDVGIHKSEAGIQGDVEFTGVSEIASAITPVPGGVGPTTIAFLLENLMTAYTHQK